MEAGNGVNFVKAQLVELVRMLLEPGVVRLVRHEQDLFSAGADLGGDVFIQRAEPRLHIHHKEDGIGGSDGGVHLFFDHPVPEADTAFFALIHAEPAGIEEGEAAFVKDTGSGDAVPGHAAVKMHDRLSALENGIEQGRFAHIGSANDGNGGKRTAHVCQRIIARIPFFVPILLLRRLKFSDLGVDLVHIRFVRFIEAFLITFCTYFAFALHCLIRLSFRSLLWSKRERFPGKRNRSLNCSSATYFIA